MKKIILLLVCIFVVLGTGFMKETSGKIIDQTVLADKLIRFHVIANSDSVEDQSLKLKVRDEILSYIAPKLKESKGIEASRKILKENEKKISSIARKVIQNNGFQYGVKVELSHEAFPVKSYGNITLPQGEYEAYRIIIGEGKGQNWWCVMFPPLCFIDITKGEVAKEETEKQMKEALSQEEYEAIDNSSDLKNVKFEFKIVNIIKEVLQ